MMAAKYSTDLINKESEMMNTDDEVDHSYQPLLNRGEADMYEGLTGQIDGDRCELSEQNNAHEENNDVHANDEDDVNDCYNVRDDDNNIKTDNGSDGNIENHGHDDNDSNGKKDDDSIKMNVKEMSENKTDTSDYMVMTSRMNRTLHKSEIESKEKINLPVGNENTGCVDSDRDDVDEMGYLRMADSIDNTGYTVMAANVLSGEENINIVPLKESNNLDELELTDKGINENHTAGHVSSHESLLVMHVTDEVERQNGSNSDQEEIDINGNDDIALELALENIEEDGQEHIYADLYDEIAETSISKSLCSTNRIRRWWLPSVIVSSAFMIICVLVVLLVTQNGPTSGKH